MHENAEITGAILDTGAMTSVILSLLPRSGLNIILLKFCSWWRRLKT